MSIRKVLKSEVPWEGTRLQLLWDMANGDHGHLHLRGEHNVGHGAGEELLSAQVDLPDHHRETEDLRYQSEPLSHSLGSTFSEEESRKAGDLADFIRNISQVSLEICVS